MFTEKIENEQMVIELKKYVEKSGISKNKTETSLDPFLILLTKNNISSEPLTPRELEIFRAIIVGLTNTHIGEKLHISVNTVKTHNRKIYNKLNISNKEEIKFKIDSIKY